MFAEKSSDNASLVQREQERAYRKEYQLILKRCNQIGFQYIINRPPSARICFGSGVKRETLPMRGSAMSSFMARHTMESFKYPFRFQTSPKKYSCAESYGLMMSKTSRFTTKDVDGGPAISVGSVLSAVPEQKAAKSRWALTCPGYMPRKGLVTPGVGTYNIDFKRKQIVRAAFGAKICHKPATITLCSPEQRERCQKCKTTPEIDYWKHFRLGKCYCRPCLQAEIDHCNTKSRTKSLKIKRLKHLREYERVRYCGYVHKHDMARAYLQILPQPELVRKIRRENYLSMFYM